MRRSTLALLITASGVAAACSGAPAADARGGADGRTQTAVEMEAGGPPAESVPAAELNSIALRVPDMSCGLCAKPIEHNLREMGVRDVKADLETRWVTGRFDPERLTPEAIRAKVEDLRFRVAEVRVG
jgi:copper chaperone CopZ